MPFFHSKTCFYLFQLGIQNWQNFFGYLKHSCSVRRASNTISHDKQLALPSDDIFTAWRSSCLESSYHILLQTNQTIMQFCRTCMDVLPIVNRKKSCQYFPSYLKEGYSSFMLFILNNKFILCFNNHSSLLSLSYTHTHTRTHTKLDWKSIINPVRQGLEIQL